MYNTRSSPTLSNVTFAGNTSGTGGGMTNDQSSPTLTNVTFSGNTAASGGGMYNFFNSTAPTLTNVVFSGNKATDHGGGIYNIGAASPTLINVTFFGNTADNKGGGIYNDRGDPIIVNTLFWNNTGGASSETVGQQIYIDNERGNTENLTISFSLVQHGIGVTTGATSDNDAADGLGIGGGSALVTITQAHNISGDPNLAADSG